MPATLDDVLLWIEAAVREEDARNPGKHLFLDLEAEQILASRVLRRRRKLFARICREQGLGPDEFDVLARRINWVGVPSEE